MDARRRYRSLMTPPTRLVTHGPCAPVMDRLREMNVRTLLNTRIDLNSLRTPPPSPYTCGTPTVGSASTPDLSPSFSMLELSESPCPTPPPASPHFPSFILPPPEDTCATIKTTDGREINADLIVRTPVVSHRFSTLTFSVALLYRPETQHFVVGGVVTQFNQP